MPRPQLSDALAFAAIEAVRAHDGNMSEAARTLGLSRTTLQSRYNAGVQRTAALGVEAPHLVKGTSTLFDGEGKAKLQWVKTKLDDKLRWQMMLEAIEARCGDITPRAPVLLDTRHTPNSELCNLVTMTDCHVGPWPGRAKPAKIGTCRSPARR